GIGIGLSVVSRPGDTVAGGLQGHVLRQLGGENLGHCLDATQIHTHVLVLVQGQGGRRQGHFAVFLVGIHTSVVHIGVHVLHAVGALLDLHHPELTHTPPHRHFGVVVNAHSLDYHSLTVEIKGLLL